MQLSDCKILRDLPPAIIEVLSAAASSREYDVGEPVITQGEKGDSLFFLLEGSARVLIGGDDSVVDLTEFLPGDHFGELSMIDGLERSATVVAVTKCRVAVIDRSAMLAAMHEAPSLRLALMEQLARMIRNEQERIASLSAEEILKRILRTLLDLAEPAPSGRGGWYIPRLPPHKELARMAGTSPDIVAHVIGQLVRQELVKRETSALIIRDRRRIKEEINSLSLVGNSQAVRS